MMKVKLSDLLEKRAKLVTEARTLNEIDAPSAEQTARLDAIVAELDGLEKRIRTQALLDEADRRTEGTAVNGNDSAFDRELRGFSLVRALASQVPDIAGNVDAGREREISAELQRRYQMPVEGIAIPLQVFEVRRRDLLPNVERRVLTSTAPAGGPGSNLIPTDHLAAEYIDLLRANLITSALGARVLNDLHGNVDLPKMTASAGSAWIAENGALTPADPQFNQVSLTPKHVGVITEFSRNMLLQSSPDIEQLLRQDFAASLATAIDSAALNGGGSNEPDGIIGAAGYTDIDMSPATWDGILSFISAVEIENAAVGRLGWAEHPSVTRILRGKVKVSSDAGAGFLQDSPREIAGYPAMSSTSVPGVGSPPSGSLIFGNWADLIIGYWGALSILVNPYETTAYKKGNVQIRGMLTADVAQRHQESFAASTSVTSA
jgi:HK97 family phage major capsid protein